MPDWRSIAAVARKDIEEVRRQPGVLVPALLAVIGLTVPAFLVMFVTPRLTGEALGDSEFADAAMAAAALVPGLEQLEPEARAQAFVLQQFLMFGLLAPVLGSLALAAQSIIGEKQARALEPLLATPITTGELLIGKTAAPFAMALALLGLTSLIFSAGAAAWGAPGVWRTLLWPRTLVLVLLIGPLVSLTALLAAAIISSRVNDARTAQQIGGVLVLPVTAVFVAQLAGQFLLGPGTLLITAAVLVLLNVALAWIGVRVFQRETILVRWK